MRFLRYKCPLPQEDIPARFGRFAATGKHSPMNPFQSYDDPRIGLHTYVAGDFVIGYYEDGTRTRGGSLQSMKVWFELKVKPCEGGSRVRGVVYSSPYFLILAAVMLLSALHASFTDLWGGAFLFAMAAVFLFIEGWSQKRVVEQILALAPKTKRK